MDYQYPWGWGELQGIAYRTDFDLRAHQTHSGKDMQYNDPVTGARYIPHVIEPSFGLSRTVLATMLDAYDEEVYVDGSGSEQTRVVARFPKQIAPVKFAILPLLKKDDAMVDKAKELYADLSEKYLVEYDDGGNIGKRYRRQDEIGTPFCVTIDHQTLEDNTVTVRMRDDMSQERVAITAVASFMN
ncbi:MAG: anticodon-binding protein [Candidatus Peribacteria bacterium]|nr:MAG: anticodon-binding protein [Candidatus Peribacteria bacterium]